MFGEAAAGASAETGRGRRGAETGKRSWRLKPSAGDAHLRSTQMQAGSLHWRIRLLFGSTWNVLADAGCSFEESRVDFSKIQHG